MCEASEGKLLSFSERVGGTINRNILNVIKIKYTTSWRILIKTVPYKQRHVLENNFINFLYTLSWIHNREVIFSQNQVNLKNFVKL